MASTVSRLAIATTIAFAFHAQTAFAEDAGADGGSAKPLTKVEAERDKALGDDPHDRGGILVTSQGLEELDIIAGQTVLRQAEIQRNLNGQIGEVLAKVPGVSATGFAPGASRPILRGLDGERVRVLIDGIGTADVGNTSADHATAVEPLLAQRVEVLRGPAALLFGSQSIGGVVNVIDKRIPVEMPEKDFHLDALVSADTANDLVSGGASLDIGLGPSFVLHLDGSYRDTGDVDIPGFQLAPDFRADLLADAAEEEAEGELEEAEEIREAANQEGRLPNSGTQTYSFNGGLGVILGDSTSGFSVGYYDTDYGLIGVPVPNITMAKKRAAKAAKRKRVKKKSSPSALNKFAAISALISALVMASSIALKCARVIPITRTPNLKAPKSALFLTPKPLKPALNWLSVMAALLVCNSPRAILKR